MKELLLATIFAATAARAAGNSVIGSKHDLSVTGPGPIRARSETQVCIFCHVPHNPRGRAGLSSRPDPIDGHRPYESTTSRDHPGAPTGATRICLSCHDGTIAVGQTTTARIEMNAAAPGGKIPADRPSNLGTDLRNTHPVSFVPSASGDPHRPAPGDRVRLDAQGQLQCTSCHDAHSEFGGSREGKFLVKGTRSAELCATCHPVRAWSSHLTSPRPFLPAQGNEVGYASVGEAGCMSCHRSHNGDRKGRLLSRGPTEADDALCLRCHASSTTRVNIGIDLHKPFAHAADGWGRHDAAEGPDSAAYRLPEASVTAPRHAVCVDCHDPHEANTRAAAAPTASGLLAGASGIDSSGRRVAPARYEYEICFKCHADSQNQPQARGPSGTETLRRAMTDVNLRRVFDPGAPSYHPVVATGRSSDVPSLRPPYSTASFIYCSDCHASDSGPGAGGSGARGPHGSIYPHILERNYSTADFTTESPSAYALCYKCHDRDVLLSDRSAFQLHRRHVVDARAPCSSCHASHGVSAIAGTPLNNSHLIDFDVSIVQPDQRGIRQYSSGGARGGSCSLTCHGHPHDATRYPDAGSISGAGALRATRASLRTR